MVDLLLLSRWGALNPLFMFEFLPIISSHSTPLFEYLRLSPNKTTFTVILTLKLKKNEVKILL